MAARSGLAASVASARPSHRTSPPLRSAPPGSTTPGRPAHPRLTPTPPESKPNSPRRTAPSHPEVHDIDVEAAAARLSDTLLSYSHRD